MKVIRAMIVGYFAFFAPVFRRANFSTNGWRRRLRSRRDIFPTQNNTGYIADRNKMVAMMDGTKLTSNIYRRPGR